MMRIFISILITSLFSIGHAQTVLLEQDVYADTVIPTTGPNYKHFVHGFMGYGWFVDQFSDASATVKPGVSGNFSYGMRYKRKFSEWYATGFDWQYDLETIAIKQDSAKRFPNRAQHDKEKLIFNKLSMQWYHRVNFGKRGNSIGRYVDVGVYGSWTFLSTHKTRDNYSLAVAGASYEISKKRGLNYAELMNYGASIRLGINQFSLVARYRISSAITPAARSATGLQYPELPRLILGFELGLFE